MSNCIQRHHCPLCGAGCDGVAWKGLSICAACFALRSTDDLFNSDKYVTKQETVDAFELTPTLALDCLQKHKVAPFGLHIRGTYNGDVLYEAYSWIDLNDSGDQQRVGLGDWVVQYANGSLRAYSKKEFREKYQPQPDNSAELEKLLGMARVEMLHGIGSEQNSKKANERFAHVDRICDQIRALVKGRVK